DSADGVTLWEVASGRVVQIFKGHPHVFSVAFSPNGKLLAAAAPARVVENGKEFLGHVVKLWAVAGGPQVRTFQVLIGGGPPNREFFALGLGCVAFSPDGQRLACSGGSLDNEWGWVELFDVAADQGVLLDWKNARLVAGVAFCPDGNRLA